MEAVRQTIAAYSGSKDIFLITFFHTDELLSSRSLERFVLNLESLSCFADRLGFGIMPVTLNTAASVAKEQSRTQPLPEKVTSVEPER